MNTINPEEARKKHVPTEKEKKEILGGLYGRKRM